MKEPDEIIRYRLVDDTLNNQDTRNLMPKIALKRDFLVLQEFPILISNTLELFKRVNYAHDYGYEHNQEKG